jgi:lipopolysaccharide transport system ATP-binding protein
VAGCAPVSKDGKRLCRPDLSGQEKSSRSGIAISVENLSKRYLIGHQTAQREPYTALREIVQRETRNFLRKAADLLHGRQIVQGDEVEEFWALRDVSFEVEEGEVVGIIGRNGAGKSTLLKILSRITEPTEGRARLRGRVGSLLEVGTGFHPELTGRENIILNGAILGMSQNDIRRRFEEIVAFAELERFIDTPVKRFSSGMYVRLAFAVAAHLEPEILVVDEVLAVGDIEFQRKCLGKMSEVARAGRTVLFVSHNQSALRSLCTHGIVLRNGRGSPKRDIFSALDDYLSKCTTLSNSWRRSPGIERPPVRFESIDVRLEGAQPKLRLECACVIVLERMARPVSIAVNVTDGHSFSIMQAEPHVEPFIGGTGGTYNVALTIDLPPLVPGIYGLDFWIGPHNMETFDWIREAITFEILESPTPGRTFPHSRDHGFIVPISRARVRKSENLRHAPMFLQ